MPTEPETTAAPPGAAPGPTPGLDMRYIGPDPQAAGATAGGLAGGPSTTQPKKRAGLWVAGAGLALLAVKVGSVVLHLGVFAHLFGMFTHAGK